MSTSVEDNYTRKMIITDSTNVDELWYDLVNERMVVIFLTGGNYQYDGVSPSQFASIALADSVGTVLRKMIKKHNWPYAKIS